MDLLMLNAVFEPVRYISAPLNIQWTRRYFEPGEFSIQITAGEYSAEYAYVSVSDRPELGIIQKIEYSRTYRGATVQLSGLFAEALLNEKVFYPRYTGRGSAETLCRNVFTAYKDDLPISLGTAAGLGSSAELDKLGDIIGKTLAELLKTQGLAHRVRWDNTAGELLYEVWAGKNRTQSQTVNSWAVFSQALGTLASPKYTLDDSAWRNYFVIQANKENGIITETLDLSGGGRKRVHYIDKLSSAPAEGQTTEQFRASLRQELAEAADKYAIAEEYSITAAAAAGIDYLSGYDLGDVCDIVIDDIGKSEQSRIIEVREVWKSGQHTVEPIFGTGIPTIYRRVRL